MFITQHQFEDEAAGFSIDLPGKVYRCGEATVQTIVPRARIVIPGEVPIRAARISAEVTDDLSRRRAIDDLLAQIDCRSPLNFALRLTTAHSMGEVLDAAANARGKGCGCGCNLGEAALPGAVAIGLAPGAGGDLKWSDAVGATIYARSDGALDYGGKDSACFIAVRSDCSEDWELFNGTTCTGLQCPPEEDCKCGENALGKPKTKCDGWVRCNCNP
jgi:hypothetical protein